MARSLICLVLSLCALMPDSTQIAGKTSNPLGILTFPACALTAWICVIGGNSSLMTGNLDVGLKNGILSG
ncbi:MAG: hypothetical protein WBE76_28685 [Terracidiphilus sp.]